MIYQTKVDKLAISNTKGDYQSYVYVAPSDRQGTTGLGQLFIVAEAKSREKKIPSILNQLVDELSEYYYHSPTKNTEAALETAAQYFNENIGDITGKNLRWLKEKMSILMATIQDNKLIISNFGGLSAWLFRNNKIHDITAGGNNKDVTGKKILCQLISGQLVDGDVLLLTNNTIFDYFSDEKIKKTVMGLAPTQACAFFKNTLLDYKVSVDFSTIIIKFMAFKKAPQQIIDATAGTNVLKAADNVEILNKAEPGIAAKIFIKLAGWVKNGLAKIYALVKKAGTLKMRGKKEAKKEVGELSGMNVKSEEQIAREDEKKRVKGLAFKKWKSFNIVEYRLILLIILAAILFTGSLFIVNNKKKNQVQNEEFQALVEEINGKINSVEAALIYKDEARAQELLSEANDLLAKLTNNNPQEQYQYQELKNELAKQVKRIYNLETITNPEVLVELPQDFAATSNIYADPNNIIYLARGAEIYKVNTGNKALDKVASITGQIKKLVYFEKNKLLILTKTGEVWIMDTNNYGARKITLELPKKSQLVDLATYGLKIYLLDGGNNNIYKYNYQTTSFGTPSKWLSGEDDLTGNEVIVVDGSVWLAAKDGQISKFFKGKKEVFGLKGAYEKISSQTLLVTNETSNNLYLLDRDKNRILIADKTGQVSKQLLGDELEKIVSIAPNSNERELYLMTVNKVYKIGL
ncbi:hypothetical protein GW853_01985 [Candidatus Kuenenbacteria bacterium]|nr:hypothetical protein [Candidatus Kuenenbacteria bacterium]